MGKYRRKPSPVDAYQLVDNDWLVIDGGRQAIYSPKEFDKLFEPVAELIDTGIGIFPASQAVATGERIADRLVKEDMNAAAQRIQAGSSFKIVDPSKL